jgi:hypothetical protein
VFALLPIFPCFLFVKQLALQHKRNVMAELTFNELPEAVSRLIKQVDSIEQLLKNKSKETPPQEDCFLSLDEASAFLKKAKATIYGLVSQNKIPYMKQAKKLYFSRQVLTEWIQSGRSKSQDELTAEIDAAILNSNKKRRC